MKYFLFCISFIFIFTACERVMTVPQKDAPSAGHVIEHFSITETDGGKLKLTMRSELAEIDDIANTAVIYNPTISFYKDGKYSATLTMQRAEINLDNYNVIGVGNCVVKTADGQVLKTTDIHYDSKNNKVYSKKGVQIQRGNEFLKGASFEADTSLKNIVIYKQSIVIDDVGNNSI